MEPFILSTISGFTYIITEEQRDNIAKLIDSSVKAIVIGDSTIAIHQIVAIEPLRTYRRQMRTKLASSGQRMCDRCGTIVPRMDKCPCKEQSEKFPDILSVARLENPALDQYLTALAEKVSLPSAP